MIIELLLAAHCRDCTTCVKSGDCNLQTLAHRFGVTRVRFENYKEPVPLDLSSPSIVRDPNKCILCGNCVRVCDELQGIGAIDFAYRGTDAMVMPAFDRQIAETDCVNCGQCRVFCPTGAITIRTNIGEVWKALADKDTRVVAQIAPAVRVAAGDAFGLPKGENAMGKIVAALHRMGFDEVFDTSYSADLTIMEESAEFLKRLEKGENLPPPAVRLGSNLCRISSRIIKKTFPPAVLRSRCSPRSLKNITAIRSMQKAKRLLLYPLCRVRQRRWRQNVQTVIPKVRRIRTLSSPQRSLPG